MKKAALPLTLAALAVLLLGSEGAEAVRKAIQIPVGEGIVKKEEEPEVVAPTIKKETVWHAPAPKKAAETAEPVAPVARVPEDEMPEAPAALTDSVPVVDVSALLLQLQYDPTQMDISMEQQPALDAIVMQLQAKPMMRILLNSYASPREGQMNEARRISLKRAMSVRKYLIGKGIDKNRINVRSLGAQTSDEPKDRMDITPL